MRGTDNRRFHAFLCPQVNGINCLNCCGHNCPSDDTVFPFHFQRIHIKPKGVLFNLIFIIMKKNGKNEELQSRREFFKKAAKGALPILGAIVLANAPAIASAAEEAPMGCNYSCYGSCSGHCTGSCTGCGGLCQVGCQSSCKGSCDRLCMGTCSSTCHGSCSGRSKY